MKQITFANIFDFLFFKKNSHCPVNSFLIGKSLYIVFYLTQKVIIDKLLNKLLLTNNFYRFANEDELYRTGDDILVENEQVYFIIIG